MSGQCYVFSSKENTVSENGLDQMQISKVDFSIQVNYPNLQ